MYDAYLFDNRPCELRDKKPFIGKRTGRRRNRHRYYLHFLDTPFKSKMRYIGKADFMRDAVPLARYDVPRVVDCEWCECAPPESDPAKANVINGIPADLMESRFNPIACKRDFAGVNFDTKNRQWLYRYRCRNAACRCPVVELSAENLSLPDRLPYYQAGDEGYCSDEC